MFCGSLVCYFDKAILHANHWDINLWLLEKNKANTPRISIFNVFVHIQKNTCIKTYAGSLSHSQSHPEKKHLDELLHVPKQQ